MGWKIKGVASKSWINISEINISSNEQSYSNVGQTGRLSEIRHKEHTRYIKTKNRISAYALHILNNKHEYGNTEQTTELLKPCNKGVKMNILESFFIYTSSKNKTY